MTTMLTKEQKELIGSEARHKTNNHLAALGFDIGEFTKEQALAWQTIKFMQKDIDDIKTLLTEFIKSAPDKFASKEDHQENKDNIEKINKVFFWLWGIIGSTIVIALLNLIIKNS